jgi:hypothetical protein
MLPATGMKVNPQPPKVETAGAGRTFFGIGHAHGAEPTGIQALRGALEAVALALSHLRIHMILVSRNLKICHPEVV